MPQAIVAIIGKLAKSGSKDIDLIVHSHRMGSPSPCVVIEDFSGPRGIGGSIQSLEQIFQLQVANHPGYVVKHRAELVVSYPESEREPDEGAKPQTAA